MSGYGLATDDAGNILFVTGNSDYSGTTYDGVTNIQESVVKVSPTLTTVLDLFTPKNQATLDQFDADFGSGGVLVLPDQPRPKPHLAVAAGKAGTMFLMNESIWVGTRRRRTMCWAATGWAIAGAASLISWIRWMDWDGW